MANRWQLLAVAIAAFAAACNRANEKEPTPKATPPVVAASNKGTAQPESLPQPKPVPARPHLEVGTPARYGPVTLGLSGDDHWLAVGQGAGHAWVWDLARGKKAIGDGGPYGDRMLVALAGAGPWLVTCEVGEPQAHLWQIATGKEIRVFRGHTDLIWAIALSKDGQWLLTASNDQTARLWEVTTGREVRKFSAGQHGVFSVALSADHQWVITGQGNRAYLWELGTGKQVRSFEGSGMMDAVALSADNGWLFTSAHVDDTVQMWDLASATKVRTFHHQRRLAAALALSGDAPKLVTASFDGSVKLWDTATGKEVRAFAGHRGEVPCVALTRDGKRLFTGGYNGDGTTRLWDVDSGQELCQLLSVEDGTWAVFDKEGRYDSSDGAVKDIGWRIAADEVLPLNELRKSHHDPGLLAKYLGWNKEPLRVLGPGS